MNYLSFVKIHLDLISNIKNIVSIKIFGQT